MDDNKITNFDELREELAACAYTLRDVQETLDVEKMRKAMLLVATSLDTCAEAVKELA